MGYVPKVGEFVRLLLKPQVGVIEEIGEDAGGVFVRFGGVLAHETKWRPTWTNYGAELQHDDCFTGAEVVVRWAKTGDRLYLKGERTEGIVKEDAWGDDPVTVSVTNSPNRVWLPEECERNDDVHS